MTKLDSSTKAIEDWTHDLGCDAVYSDPAYLNTYTQSACASERQIIAVLKPSSSEHVQQIVKTANIHRIPLYPISSGKQWGMGSRLPVRDGAAIVDLGGMNRIIEVNAQFHYAVVEPGVTQRQILDYIEEKKLPLMLNVTGSASDTSLIGNAMDRGVGYFDSRAHGISNMEIVLGNGESIHTGFGHYGNAKTKNLYRHGVGPSLDGLFPQANYGIVTSACIDLMPKPDEHLSAIIKLDYEENLSVLIDVLAQLRTRGIFNSIAHVGNRERSFMTLAPLLYEQLLKAGEPNEEGTRKKAVALLEEGGFGPWSVAIGILGTSAQLKFAKREIKKAVGGIAKTMFLNDQKFQQAHKICALFSFIPAINKKAMLLNAIEPIYGFTRGESTDAAIKGVYWAAGDYEHLTAPDPDHSDSGVMFCLPIIPADGKIVAEVVNDTRDTFARYGFEAAITVNLMDTKSMEGVVSLAFDRRDAKQVQAAKDCIQKMESRYVAQGYPPYRVGINSMHQIVNEDDSFWRTVRDLKKVLDPNNIIAPGRYNLL